MGLRSLLAEELPSAPSSDALAERVSYARDCWQRTLIELSEDRPAHQGAMPGAVVWPSTRAEIERLVELARREGFALVPFGAGSGVCGGIQPNERSVVVDLKRMKQVEVLPEQPVVRVGPGALGLTLEEDLERQGFTIGHFPSSIVCSTVGGWVAARGAGQCSTRYGKIEDMLVSVECVLGAGRSVRFRRRSGGLDLTPLLVGSEGTLGILSEIELRLVRAPRKRAFAAYRLETGRAGTSALRSVMQAGLRPSVARLYDPLDTLLFERSARQSKGHGPSSSAPWVEHLVKRGAHALLERAPFLNRVVDGLERSPFGHWLLILIFEGDEPEAELSQAQALIMKQGAKALGENPARAWYAHRYSVSFKQSKVFRAGVFNDTMEVAAPWSKLDALYDNVRRALGRHVLVLAHISHAYPDGSSIYFTFSGTGRDRESAVRTYDAAWRDALDAARESGAVISHHHGVGRSKAAALERELGPAAAVLRRVLRAWDPDAILNPGALLPADPSAHPAPSEPELGLDRTSKLFTSAAYTRLAEVEENLEREQLTLGADVPLDLTAGQWVERGLPGQSDPFLDPTDHTLAGLSGSFGTGEELVLEPAPRRATGPDLSALFVGANGALGKLGRVTLRARSKAASGSSGLPFAGDRSPALSDDEQVAWQDLVRALTR